MKITYSIEVQNGISLAPLDKDTIKGIRRVACMKGIYSFAWSLSEPAQALLCDPELQEEGECDTCLGLTLAPWSGAEPGSLLQLAPYFEGCVEDEDRIHAGCFSWQAGSSEVAVNAELLTHPYAVSGYCPFDSDAACNLGLPAKEGKVEWSHVISPESPIVAIARCHSWESWNPVEFWDTIAKQLLHTIKDEKVISSATPKYSIAFNANGSLLYFSNGFDSSAEIWGCVTN